MDNQNIPTTVRQAFRILDSILTPEDKERLQNMSRSEFLISMHFGLGAWIRNNWIYGASDDESKEERELRDRCYRMLSGTNEDEPHFEHPDSVSEHFLKKYYDHLKRCGHLSSGKAHRH